MVSLMNGLSQMGAGIASFAGSAGLEEQKQALARQGMVLADQLATAREHTGRVEAGEIAEKAAQKEFGYKQELQGPQLETQRFVATTGAEATKAAAFAHAGAILGASRNAAQASIAVEMLRANELSPEAKTLRYLGIPQGAATPGATTPATPGMPPPAVGGEGSPQAPAPDTSTSDTSGTPSAGPTASTQNPMTQNLLAHVLHQPLTGSDEAIRQAIAADIDKDPKFANATPGEKGAEIKLRFAAAGGVGSRGEVQFKRVAVAATEAAQAAANIMELPGTSTSGLFAGRGQKPGLLSAVKESLTNAVTSQDVQTYNTLLAGMSRSLATIETSGLAPPGSTTSSMETLTLKEGDTELTKMRKMAEVRQIVEKGLEVNLADPKIPAVQKDQLRGVLAQIQSAIPFTHHDITALQKADDPSQTLGGIAAARLGGGASSAAKPPVAASPTQIYGNAGEGAATPNIYGSSPSTARSPPPPPDPAAREQNKTYTLPGGRLGLWRGTGWQVLQ